MRVCVTLQHKQNKTYYDEFSSPIRHAILETLELAKQNFEDTLNQNNKSSERINVFIHLFSVGPNYIYIYDKNKTRIELPQIAKQLNSKKFIPLEFDLDCNADIFFTDKEFDKQRKALLKSLVHQEIGKHMLKEENLEKALDYFLTPEVNMGMKNASKGLPQRLKFAMENAFLEEEKYFQEDFKEYLKNHQILKIAGLQLKNQGCFKFS